MNIYINGAFIFGLFHVCTFDYNMYIHCEIKTMLVKPE